MLNIFPVRTARRTLHRGTHEAHAAQAVASRWIIAQRRKSLANAAKVGDEAAVNRGKGLEVSFWMARGRAGHRARRVAEIAVGGTQNLARRSGRLINERVGLL